MKNKENKNFTQVIEEIEERIRYLKILEEIRKMRKWNMTSSNPG